MNARYRDATALRRHTPGPAVEGIAAADRAEVGFVPRGDGFIVLADLTEALAGERFYPFQREVYDRKLGTPNTPVVTEGEKMLRIDPSRISATDVRAVLDDVLRVTEARLDRQDVLREEEATASVQFEAGLRVALAGSRAATLASERVPRPSGKCSHRARLECLCGGRARYGRPRHRAVGDETLLTERWIMSELLGAAIALVDGMAH